MKTLRMQVAAAAPGRLLHCLAILLLALCFASIITAAAEVDARQRILSTLMVDDDGCHSTVLSNPLPSDDFTLVEGVIFSLRSGVSTSVSSLSVFLDESAISPSIGFDVFTMNGYDQNSIGATLDGSGDWKRIHNGTIEDTQLDNDGATFLGSFGPLLQIEAGDTKSIYLRFTKSVLRVKNLGGVDADGWDANATNLNDNDMQISIGRAAIFWITTNPDQFHQFYTPSIIPCKVWTQETCAPTASPTTTSSPTTIRIFETETIVNNNIDLSFQARRLMFDTSSRNLQDVCSVNKEVIYPLLADSLEDVSMGAYKEDPIGTTRMFSTTITFHSHEDVSAEKDCSVIRFYYDVQIEYAIAEDDETPPIELILLPLSDDSKRDQFLSTLTTNANENGIPYFSTLSSIGPVVVNQEGLRTRQPTATPTILSVSPTLAPSMSSMPMTQLSASSALSISPCWVLNCIMKLCISWSIFGFFHI